MVFTITLIFEKLNQRSKRLILNLQEVIGKEMRWFAGFRKGKKKLKSLWEHECDL